MFSHSLIVSGQFGLFEGVVPEPPAGSAKNHLYAYYKSTFTCDDGTARRAEIRLYVKSTHDVLPDFTVALVYGNMFIPARASLPILIDAAFLYPIPGDPSTPAYDNAIPPFDNPLIFGVGHVKPSPKSQRSIHIATTAYIRGSFQSTTINGLFDNDNRWRKVPLINASSCVFVMGRCVSLSPEVLSFSIENIATSLAPDHSAASASPQIGSIGITRKYTPFVEVNEGDDSVVGGPSSVPVARKFGLLPDVELDPENAVAGPSTHANVLSIDSPEPPAKKARTRRATGKAKLTEPAVGDTMFSPDDPSGDV